MTRVETSPEILEAKKKLEAIFAIGQIALNLENEASQLRRVLRQSGEHDGNGMITVFEAPDLHYLLLRPPDKRIIRLEKLAIDGSVDYLIDCDEGATEAEFRRSLALDRMGSTVFLGDAIKTDHLATGLWVYDIEHQRRAAIGSDGHINIISEQEATEKLRPYKRS